MTGNPSRVRRLIGGAGGQAFLKGAMVVYQLATVPLLIGSWGLATYGSWLALTVLAAIMSNANFGVASAFRVAITATPMEAPYGTIGSLVKTAHAMLAVLLSLAAAALFAAVLSLPVGRWLNLEGVTDFEIRAVVSLVVVQVVLESFRAVPAALILRTGRYGWPSALTAILKFIELAALAVLVLKGAGLVSAAAVGCISALLNLVAHWFYAGRWHGWIGGAGHVDPSLARAFLAPSIGNFLLALGANLLAIYGLRLLLSAALGPRALAAFAVAMTSVKMIDQLNGVMVSALQYEFSRVSRADSTRQSEALLVRGGQLSLAGFLVMASALLLIGPTAFAIWTQQTVAFDYMIITIMLIGILLQQLGKSSLYFLVGTNRVLGFALSSIAFYVISLALTMLLLPRLHILGASVGFAVGEGLQLALGLHYASRHLRAEPLALFVRQFRLHELYAALVPLARRMVAR